MAHAVAESTISPASFRGLMSGFPTGVAIVTAEDAAGRPSGLTCSSLTSVTVEPPTLLVCIGPGSATLAALLDRGSFAVNLLHEGATGVAQMFSSQRRDRFEGIAWVGGSSRAGPHLTEDAHTIADCRVTQHSVVGDHTVVFGQVTDVLTRETRRPLLYGLRTYSAWPDARHDD